MKNNGYIKEKAIDITITVLITGVGVFFALNNRVTIVEQKVLAQENIDESITGRLIRIERKLDDYILNLE